MGETVSCEAARAQAANSTPLCMARPPTAARSSWSTSATRRPPREARGRVLLLLLLLLLLLFILLLLLLVLVLLMLLLLLLLRFRATKASL
jgi:hypothetical protein